MCTVYTLGAGGGEKLTPSDGAPKGTHGGEPRRYGHDLNIALKPSSLSQIRLLLTGTTHIMRMFFKTEASGRRYEQAAEEKSAGAKSERGISSEGAGTKAGAKDEAAELEFCGQKGEAEVRIRDTGAESGAAEGKR